MAKLVSAKCPECGARLKVNPAESEGTCDYCGAVSPIQVGKTQAVNTMNPSDSPVVQPGRQVIQVSGQYQWMWLIYLLIPLGILMTTGGSAFVYFMRGVSTAGEGGVSSVLGLKNSLSGAKIGWNGGKQAILFDVNGDDVSDPVGRVSKLIISNSNHTEHIGAYSGVDGKLLWLSDPLAQVNQGHLLRVTMVDGVLLVADHMGILKALAPNNGQIKWTATVGERVERICGASPGKAQVETTDERVILVNLATGQLEPEKKEDVTPFQCRGGWSADIKRGTARVERMGGAFYSGEPLPEMKGMDVEFVFHEIATGTLIATGKKESGTRVPMAARYNKVQLTEKEANELKKRYRSVKTTPTWLTNVPAVNPLSVYEEAPKTAAISLGRVIIPYRMQDSGKGWRLACLDVSSGKNLWDVSVPNLGRDVEAVVASDRQIFVSTWNGLHIFDLNDGAFRVTVASMM